MHGHIETRLLEETGFLQGSILPNRVALAAGHVEVEPQALDIELQLVDGFLRRLHQAMLAPRPFRDSPAQGQHAGAVCIRQGIDSADQLVKLPRQAIAASPIAASIVAPANSSHRFTPRCLCSIFPAPGAL
jgi:hypothetical protein